MAEKERGLTPEQWSEVEAEFRAGTPRAALARKYGVSRNTIIAHERRGGWTLSEQAAAQVCNRKQSTPQELRSAANAKVVDIASRRAVEKLEASGELETAAKEIAADLAEHAELSRLLMRASKRTLAEFMLDRIAIPKGSTATKADLFAAIVNGVRSAVSISREIHGRVRGEASQRANGGDEGRIVIEQRRLEPVKIAVDERGRATGG